MFLVSLCGAASTALPPGLFAGASAGFSVLSVPASPMAHQQACLLMTALTMRLCAFVPPPPADAPPANKEIALGAVAALFKRCGAQEDPETVARRVLSLCGGSLSELVSTDPSDICREAGLCEQDYWEAAGLL